MLMSLLAAPASLPASRTKDRQSAWQPRGIALQIGLMMLVLLLPSLLLLASDPRQFNGISVWIKPIKFHLSLALHFATLAILVDLVAPTAGAQPFLRHAFVVAGLAGLFEAGYITLQAARGRASHFNDGTPLEAALYTVMGVGAVLLVLVAFHLGRVILASPRPGLGAGLRLGAGLGLTLGAVATLLTAGILGSGAIPEALGQPIGHWIGGDRSDATGLPLLGWSTTGGDLRVPHFFATHVMQILPLVGWLADRYRPATARVAVLAAAAVLLAAILATFGQAVSGIPFLPV